MHNIRTPTYLSFGSHGPEWIMGLMATLWLLLSMLHTFCRMKQHGCHDASPSGADPFLITAELIYITRVPGSIINGYHTLPRADQHGPCHTLYIIQGPILVMRGCGDG